VVCAPGFESFFTIDNQPDGANKSATLTWANASNRSGISLIIDNEECADPPP
jgi:hypothetical protein